MRYYMMLCGLLWSVVMWAQPRAEIGLMIGGANYLGDLQSEQYFPTLDKARMAIGGYYALPLHYNWQLRAQGWWANYSGADVFAEDAELRARDFSFTGRSFSAQLQAVWEPFGKKRYPETGGYTTTISPYFITGVGYTFYQRTTSYGNPGVDGFPDPIKADQAADTAPALTLPFGGGLRFDLSPRVSLGLEMTTHKTFTDQLDGVSFSGRGDTNDWLVTGSISLAYRWHQPDYDRDGFVDEEDACPQQAGSEENSGCPDSDGDGLSDNADRCPYLPGKISTLGCPDRDFDNVADLVDDCPDVPGHASARGCPDSDGDRLEDDADMCPYCPAINGLSGCPDSDDDGIEDARDRCPNLPGTTEGEGCPYVDTDRDGIKDEDDTCPSQAGLAMHNGCPDTDGDGLPDGEDRCPSLFGDEANKGCPGVSEDLVAQLALLTENVQFQTGSDQLTTASKDILSELVKILTDYPYYQLSIAGHTDSQGKAENNLRLSQARAKACYDFLLAKGIEATRMQHEGFGESQPVASNKTAVGRRKNRRVDFELEVK